MSLLEHYQCVRGMSTRDNNSRKSDCSLYLRIRRNDVVIARQFVRTVTRSLPRSCPGISTIDSYSDRKWPSESRGWLKERNQDRPRKAPLHSVSLIRRFFLAFCLCPPSPDKSHLSFSRPTARFHLAGLWSVAVHGKNACGHYNGRSSNLDYCIGSP